MVTERPGRRICATDGSKYGAVLHSAVLYTEIRIDSLELRINRSLYLL